ncbi:hypothetical protein SLEP1_g25158 [Rubroshorea leprosula]|uniref:DUF4228 domain-containing protein n=1 Tax=Rubroshorea leprosula TaxID=152421 RepID=A0AAV5JSH7_9ROSI|nr:hypothetical protein SLEP1_g25158 [Rubroshorea leprosula]
MGNCQAIDAATLVIQHPSGRVDKFYCPLTAGEVMKTNPGHYVALLISTTFYHHSAAADNPSVQKVNPVRFTKIKLLRPTDTLVLGQVYRLVTAQEVMKGLKARRHAKMKNNQQESTGKPEKETERSEPEKESKVSRHERHRPRTTTTATATSTSSSSNPVAARSKAWQPSLQSISEAGSGT